MFEGVNHAANLPSVVNDDMKELIGFELSNMIIAQYRRILAVTLFLEIDMSVDLCRETVYLCEDNRSAPRMSDTAINGPIKRQTLSPPKIIRFSGFCKGGFETKLSVEQLECINQSAVLRSWYNNQLAIAVQNGKDIITSRFYRTLLTNAHPRNTGMNAGLSGGGNVVGLPTMPLLFDPENCDLCAQSWLNVIKQMPRSTVVANEYGASAEQGFFFGHQFMEGVFAQSDNYNNYNKLGDCTACSAFSDTFSRMPRGLMPITSFCVESRVCENGGANMTIYPVLFGKRYKGAKASLRVKMHNYMSLDKESVFYRTIFYSHMHVYDARYLGVSWVTIRNEQPATVPGCGA